MGDFMKAQVLKRFPWSLGVAIGGVIFFINRQEWMLDLRGMRDAENALSYYHPYWARWLFSLLSLLPLQITFLLLSLITLLSLYFASRVFGGRHWMVFISYQLFWLFFYGQIDGIIISGLVLAYWAVERQKPFLIGLGLAVAMIKPQMSAFLIILFWLWSPSRWKTLVIPVCVVALSIIQWGFWIPEWIMRLLNFKAIYLSTATNISLWPLLGPWVLLIWLVIFFIPLERPRKIIAVTAGTMLSVPYFPIYSSLMILPMPIPVLPYALFQFSFLLPIIGADIFNWLRIVPLILLIWSIYPAKKWLNIIKKFWHKAELEEQSSLKEAE
jgi:hypothetical protein